MNKTLIAAVMVSAMLVACDGGNDMAAVPPPPPEPSGPSGPSLADVVLGLFRTTSETALPIDINGLDIDDTSEDPTLYDSLLM